MANSYPKQFKLSTAVSDRSKFSLPYQVITSNNFGVMKPICCRYMVPTDKITNMTIKEFTRLMPMPCPTFGKIDSVTRAFFVPMRSIMHSFNEFISANPYYSSSVSGTTVSPLVQNYVVPFTTVAELNLLFGTVSYGLSSSGTSSNYDFCLFLGGNATSLTYRKFTLTGKRVYDFLNSLGCAFPWLTASYGDNGSSNMRAHASQRISLLPILACLKAYIDWVVPSRYFQNYSFIQSFLRTNAPLSNGVISTSLAKLLIPLRSFLESDFYTSAFANPLVEGSGQVSANISIPNVSSSSSYKAVEAKLGAANQNASGLVDNDGAHVNGSSSLNRFTIQSLGALQSMLDRGLIGGTKIQNWLESEFGIKPNYDYLDLSSYLGRFENTISIGDVTAYADTSGQDGAYLGQYAGKGIGSGQAHFDFEAKEHGFFIVFNEVLPRTSYYQGLHPEFQMLDRFDFFQPEFDNLGMDAIPLRTLCNTQKVQQFNVSSAVELTSPNNVFGFCPRYASMKTSFDVISGDFRVKSLNTGLDSWYLSRDFDLRSGVDDEYKYISSAFCDASNGTSTNSYDRIFQYTDNFADHFYQIFAIDLNMVRPMKQISDYMIDNQEDRDKGQKVIGANVNGNDNV